MPRARPRAVQPPAEQQAPSTKIYPLDSTKTPFWYAGAIMCELTFGTSVGRGANGDFVNAQKAVHLLGSPLSGSCHPKSWRFPTERVMQRRRLWDAYCFPGFKPEP